MAVTRRVHPDQHSRKSIRTPADPAAGGRLRRGLAGTRRLLDPAGRRGHTRILTDLVTRYQLRGNIVTDAHLAALAIEHGLEVCSNHSDFARFTEIRWTNPVAPA